MKFLKIFAIVLALVLASAAQQAPVNSSSGPPIIPWAPIDASAGYLPGGDPCATIRTVVAALSNSQAAEISLAGFVRYFSDGIVPCTSNPFENQSFSGKVWWGPINLVKSVPLITPGNNNRVKLIGTGTSDVGTVIPNVNSTMQDCGPEAPGWNGTNCVIHGITVPAFPSTGHSLVFTYPHGAFGAATYYPSLWLGGGSASGVTNGGTFGGSVEGMTIWSGQGGGDFSIYITGEQEGSYLNYNSMRAANRACIFYDRVQSTSTGPTHFSGRGNDCRMDTNETAAQGYPNVANQLGAGYGVFDEGNADVVYATGGTCTTYPQAYPSAFASTGLSAYTLTNPGSCSNVTGLTCNIGSNRGTGATCGWTTVGNTITGINPVANGSGYTIGDTQGGGPFYWGEDTINGSPSIVMQEGIVLDGVYSPRISSVHGGWFGTNGYTLHVGYGGGPVTTGVFDNIDIENSGLGVVHVGLGADSRQTFLGIGKGGSVNSIQDDLCPDSQSGSSPVPDIWSPCGLSFQAPQWIPPYVTDTTNTNSYAVTAPGFPPTIQPGLCLHLKVTNANTGASTLNVTPAQPGSTAYGAIALDKRVPGGVAALAAVNDLAAGGLYSVCYDGAEWVAESISNMAYTAGNFAAAGGLIVANNTANQITGTSNFTLDGTKSFPAKINNESLAAFGVNYTRGATLQKAETVAADANVLTVTPAAAAGRYHVTFGESFSAANAATIGWTITYTDASGNAQTPTNMPLFQQGTAAPALTFTTSAAGDYYSDCYIDVNNAGTAIVVKTTSSGTSATAKASATVERVQ